MSGLSSIAVSVDPPVPSVPEWGNALPILHEIRHALRLLAESGEATLIDLRSLPFAPGDEDRLLGLLGTGEVQASVEALGPTHVWETAIPAVWLVDHRNQEGERIALHIEIDRVPALLCTQPEELRDAADRLDRRLAAAGLTGAAP
jgi:hydrogenase-1 operon protein HyaF